MQVPTCECGGEMHRQDCPPDCGGCACHIDPPCNHCVNHHVECQEVDCPKCGGAGYTAEHDLPNRHGEDGECVSCPVQVPCEECGTTGKIHY